MKLLLLTIIITLMSCIPLRCNAEKLCKVKIPYIHNQSQETIYVQLKKSIKHNVHELSDLAVVAPGDKLELCDIKDPSKFFFLDNLTIKNNGLYEDFYSPYEIYVFYANHMDEQELIPPAIIVFNLIKNKEENYFLQVMLKTPLPNYILQTLSNKQRRFYKTFHPIKFCECIAEEENVLSTECELVWKDW